MTPYEIVFFFQSGWIKDKKKKANACFNSWTAQENSDNESENELELEDGE